MRTTTKLSLVLGGVMAAAISTTVFAANEDTFCRAIGIQPALRQACTDEMIGATTDDQRDQVAAAWVAKSPLASNSPSSLYKPSVDNNAKNGTPGTPYQDKLASVPNEVAAQIHRAMKINHLE